MFYFKTIKECTAIPFHGIPIAISTISGSTSKYKPKVEQFDKFSAVACHNSTITRTIQLLNFFQRSFQPIHHEYSGSLSIEITLDRLDVWHAAAAVTAALYCTLSVKFTIK